MNKIKIISVILISIISISSCSKKEEKIQQKANINKQLVAKIQNMSTEKKDSGLRDGEFQYNEEDKTLKIGNSIEIKQGINNLPEGIKIYKNSEIYNNSANKNYLFFVTDDTVTNIADYYISLFKELGYKRIGDMPKERSEFLERLEFQLGEEIVFPEGDLSPEKLEEIEKNKEDIIKVEININSQIPTSIAKGMGLKGTFVEMYYRSISQ